MDWHEQICLWIIIACELLLQAVNFKWMRAAGFVPVIPPAWRRTEMSTHCLIHSESYTSWVNRAVQTLKICVPVCTGNKCLFWHVSGLQSLSPKWQQPLCHHPGPHGMSGKSALACTDWRLRVTIQSELGYIQYWFKMMILHIKAVFTKRCRVGYTHSTLRCFVWKDQSSPLWSTDVFFLVHCKLIPCLCTFPEALLPDLPVAVGPISGSGAMQVALSTSDQHQH